MNLGYDRDLYMLAFDHRGSFQKQLLGITGVPTSEQAARVSDTKALIFEGLLEALATGTPGDGAGILVDEEFGAPVARRARERGIVLAMPAEASGRDECDFEYDADSARHIEAFDTVDDDRERCAREVRPDLVVRSIGAMQAAGVEADVGKIEGLDARDDWRRVAEQARRGGRDGVACIVPGRGASALRVEQWLRARAGVPGYRGFAIRTTSWWDALVGFRDGTASRAGAAACIATNYLRAIDAHQTAAA